MNDTAWQSTTTREIAGLIKDIDICMFVTRSDGTVRGRPMSNNGKVEYDGDSWFFSFRDSPKVQEIEADPHVELAYVATERGVWISIEGTAEVVEDDKRKRELWDDALGQWFDKGPEDDAVVLVKVHANRIHAWANDEEIVAEAGGEIERIEDSGRA